MNRSSGGTTDIQGEAELYGFGVRAGGTAAIVPVLSPLPRSQKVGATHSWVELYPNTIKTESVLAYSLYPDDSLRLHSTQTVHHQRLFWQQEAGHVLHSSLP